MVVFVVVMILSDAINVYDGATWWSTPYMLYVLLFSGYAAIMCGLVGYGFGRWIIFPPTASIDGANAPDVTDEAS
jgi:hypothetical protein